MKAHVDAFATSHGAEVIRRDNRIGYKAGNLNHGLEILSSMYDFFVILDSDEIVPRTFVERTLDYMDYHPNAGVVQATHVATRNMTAFQKLYARGVDSHWPVYQSVKDGFGFMSLLGLLGAKAVFIVTLREAEKVRLREAITMNYGELGFATILIGVATLTTGSPLAVGMIALPSILSVYLTMMTAERKTRPVYAGRHKKATRLVGWEEFLEQPQLADPAMANV